MTNIDLDALEHVWTPGPDEDASGSARADVDEVLALIAEVRRLRDVLDTTVARADDMHESMVRQRDEACAAIARVEALRPTHRHRGASWGDGDDEYVAYHDVRAALRGDA